MTVSNASGMWRRIFGKTVDHGNWQEHHITIPGCSTQEELELALQNTIEVSSVAAADLFGTSEQIKSMRGALERMGIAVSPTMVISGSGEMGGLHLHAVSGLKLIPVFDGMKQAGSFFEDDHARYCLLGNLLPADVSTTSTEQAEQIFSSMCRLLESVDMSLKDAVRTWFYNESILDWYVAFNRIRNFYFMSRGITRMPASTGIGAGNPWGSALTGKLLAVQPKDGVVDIRKSPSPVQCDAFAYGSAFSRAIEIRSPRSRTLHISGTASIGVGGETLHKNDAWNQIQTTMDAVRALLEGSGMTLANTTRGIMYFRNRSDFGVWERYCSENDFKDLPLLPLESCVCREDLLFEIEIEAACSF